MPDMRSLIASMARQMYDDVRLVTEANALQPLDEDTTRHVNHLLRLARECYPTVRLMEPFQDMAPRTIKYKDTVMILGQLKEMLAQLETAEIATGNLSIVRGGPSSTSSNAVALPPISRPQNPLPARPSAASTPQPQMPAKPASRATVFPYAAATDSDEPASNMRPPTPMPKPRVVPGAPIVAPSAAERTRPAAMSDEDLYGPNPPARRNADGTVPFSLDDEH